MSYVWADAKKKIKEQLEDIEERTNSQEKLEAESRSDWECDTRNVQEFGQQHWTSYCLVNKKFEQIWSRPKKGVIGSPADTWFTQICDSIVTDIFEIRD